MRRLYLFSSLVAVAVLIDPVIPELDRAGVNGGFGVVAVDRQRRAVGPVARRCANAMAVAMS